MTALLSFVRPQKITAKIGGDFQLGGPERDRTVDLSDANRTLSQLSYRPINTIGYYTKLPHKCKGVCEIFQQSLHHPKEVIPGF